MPRRTFCVCGHSYYSHNYPMRVVRNPMRLECERVGCRCGEYVPEPDVSEEA